MKRLLLALLLLAGCHREPLHWEANGEHDYNLVDTRQRIRANVYKTGDKEWKCRPYSISATELFTSQAAAMAYCEQAVWL